MSLGCRFPCPMAFAGVEHAITLLPRRSDSMSDGLSLYR